MYCFGTLLYCGSGSAYLRSLHNLYWGDTVKTEEVADFVFLFTSCYYLISVVGSLFAEFSRKVLCFFLRFIL